MSRTEDLRALAQRVADALPPEVVEVVLTGSVSRGVADEVSDVEMLLVPVAHVELEAAFAMARDAGLEQLDTWGAPGTPTKRVSGYRDGAPLELIFWPRDYAESSVDALLAGEPSSAADALAHAGDVGADWRERFGQEHAGTAAPGLGGEGGGTQVFSGRAPLGRRRCRVAGGGR